MERLGHFWHPLEPCGVRPPRWNCPRADAGPGGVRRAADPPGGGALRGGGLPRGARFLSLLFNGIPVWYNIRHSIFVHSVTFSKEGPATSVYFNWSVHHAKFRKSLTGKKERPSNGGRAGDR